MCLKKLQDKTTQTFCRFFSLLVKKTPTHRILSDSFWACFCQRPQMLEVYVSFPASLELLLGLFSLCLLPLLLGVVVAVQLAVQEKRRPYGFG